MDVQAQGSTMEAASSTWTLSQKLKENSVLVFIKTAPALSNTRATGSSWIKLCQLVVETTYMMTLIPLMPDFLFSRCVNPARPTPCPEMGTTTMKTALSLVRMTRGTIVCKYTWSFLCILVLLTCAYTGILLVINA